MIIPVQLVLQFLFLIALARALRATKSFSQVLMAVSLLLAHVVASAVGMVLVGSLGVGITGLAMTILTLGVGNNLRLQQPV
jgi:hypothetical protein